MFFLSGGRSWEEVTPVARWAARYEHAALAWAPSRFVPERATELQELMWVYGIQAGAP